MTSGQGGSPEQPTGQPGQTPGPYGGQAWNPPPQQPPPGYPPPGYPPPGYPPPGYPPPGQPPGYPPAPGYAPAPPAGWGEAPKPVERPVTVRAGLGAFIASLVLGLIGAIVTFTQLDTLIAQALARASEQGQDVPDEVLTHDAVRLLIVVSAIIGLVLVGLEAMFLWFAWKGRNWARIVLWVIGGFGVLGGLFSLFGGSTMTSGFLEGLSLFQFLLVLAGVILLALAPSNEWYRYQRWLRDTGQRR
jgi:hypothetical protein